MQANFMTHCHRITRLNQHVDFSLVNLVTARFVHFCRTFSETKTKAKPIYNKCCPSCPRSLPPRMEIPTLCMDLVGIWAVACSCVSKYLRSRWVSFLFCLDIFSEEERRNGEKCRPPSHSSTEKLARGRETGNPLQKSIDDTNWACRLGFIYPCPKNALNLIHWANKQKYGFFISAVLQPVVNLFLRFT